MATASHQITTNNAFSCTAFSGGNAIPYALTDELEWHLPASLPIILSPKPKSFLVPATAPAAPAACAHGSMCGHRLCTALSHQCQHASGHCVARLLPTLDLPELKDFGAEMAMSAAAHHTAAANGWFALPVQAQSESPAELWAYCFAL